MPRLKYFNETTQQWEYAVVGAQGPVGPAGADGADGVIGVDGEPGSAGIVAQPSAPTDTSIIWVDTDASAIDIPIGGTAGQALTKIDGTDFNTEWSDVYSQTETDTAISNAIAGLVDTAPTALNTLNELAAALDDDENFAATVTTALSGKSDTSHTHDDRYYTETEADTLLSGKSDTSHTHDGRYYTETETDSLLSNKANLSGAAFSSGISASSIGLGGITTPTQSLELSGRAKIRSNGSESAGLWITGAAGTESSFIGASGTASTDPVGVFHNGAWRLQVDNSGRISQPYQPAFRAYYPSGGTGSIISFAGNDAAFNGRNSGWNGSTRFTAPIAGVYVFSFSILVGVSVARILFRINGTPSTNYGDPLWDGYNTYASPSMSMAFKLNANDYLELYNEQAGTYGTPFGSFSGFFVG